MTETKKAFAKVIIQIILFMVIVWILVSGSADFSMWSYLLGTLVFALGVSTIFYYGQKSPKK